MLKEAKVVITSSKFLQLKEKLDKNICSVRGYNNSIARVQGTSEDTLKINYLIKAYAELCDLLHELVVEEDE